MKLTRSCPVCKSPDPTASGLQAAGLMAVCETRIQEALARMPALASAAGRPDGSVQAAFDELSSQLSSPTSSGQRAANVMAAGEPLLQHAHMQGTCGPCIGCFLEGCCSSQEQSQRGMHNTLSRTACASEQKPGCLGSGTGRLQRKGGTGNSQAQVAWPGLRSFMNTAVAQCAPSDPTHLPDSAACAHAGVNGTVHSGVLDQHGGVGAAEVIMQASDAEEAVKQDVNSSSSQGMDPATLSATMHHSAASAHGADAAAQSADAAATAAGAESVSLETGPGLEKV